MTYDDRWDSMPWWLARRDFSAIDSTGLLKTLILQMVLVTTVGTMGTRRCWLSQGSISNLVGWGERTVRRYLKLGKDAGLIQEVNRGAGKRGEVAVWEFSLDRLYDLPQLKLTAREREQPRPERPPPRPERPPPPAGTAALVSEVEIRKEEDKAARARDVAPVASRSEFHLQPEGVDSEKRKSRPWRIVPDGEKLTPDRLKFALGKGLSQARVEREWEKFTSYEYAKAKTNVSAAWRTWAMRAAEQPERNQPVLNGMPVVTPGPLDPSSAYIQQCITSDGGIFLHCPNPNCRSPRKEKFTVKGLCEHHSGVFSCAGCGEKAILLEFARAGMTHEANRRVRP